MISKTIENLAARLLRRPTAPYHEHAVRGEIERFCEEQGLEHERDRFGNLYVRTWGPSRTRPLVLAAHMDHPGFEVLKQVETRRWVARFRGSVPESYFRRGVGVRLIPGSAKARLGRRVPGGEKTFELVGYRDGGAMPEFAVWDLVEYALRGGRIYARGCDDVIGVAAVLAALVELKRRRANVRVVGLLSRAEEVGFHGALAAADESRRAKGGSTGARIPPRALVVSLETSRELPGVEMGKGVVIRVGDKASVFDSEGSRFLSEVASEMQSRRKAFCFQRALMSGGTCEATAFQEFGFQSVGLCVPLGNYHNCGANNRVQEEYVSLDDVTGMVGLLVQAALRLGEFKHLAGRLPQRLKKLLREARPNLAKTA